MLSKIKQYLATLFTEKTTTIYMLKRKDKYFGLAGCSYIKKEISVSTDSAFDYKSDMLAVYRLEREGYFIVTKDRFNKVISSDE